MKLKQQVWDTIRIHDLKVSCIIGIMEKERIQKQEVVINIALKVDIRRACESDNIEHTVDYKTLKNKIKDFVKQSNFLLIEKMAEEIALLCLEENLVDEVLVRVEKPAALTLARTVSVEVTRNRQMYE